MIDLQDIQVGSDLLALVTGNVPHFLSIALGLLIVFVLLYLTYQVTRFILIRLQLRREYSVLEITPPHITEQNPYTTEQFFNLVHTLARQKSFIQRYFRVYRNYSFEIVSTKDDGIRYLIRVPEEDSDLVQKALMSYLPDLRIKETADYISEKHKFYTEYKLTGNPVLRLKKQDTLIQHDPIAYITGSMTKLLKNELISFQIVVTSLSKSEIPEFTNFSKQIYARMDLVSGLRQSRLSNTLNNLKIIFKLTLQIITLPLGILVFVLSNGKDGPLLKLSFAHDQQKTNNPYQSELESMIKEKLDQSLFKVSLRLMVQTDNAKRAYSIQRGFNSSLSSFTNAGYQSIQRSKRMNTKFLNRFKSSLFNKRAINPLIKIILSTAELSDLYHFPFTKTTKTEDIVKAHSRELPTPVSLKKADNLDIRFAKNTFGGTETPIGLTEDERRRHMYILGATGTGKSTLLLSMINQDMQNGKGLCVIDPHGDLIEQVLSCVPEDRINDVIYFNPDDVGYPIGINLLELKSGLSEDDSLREKEFITESIISLFQKIYTDKYSGPRMEYILRNTIHTAFLVPDATLFTVYKLLINTPFRKSVVAGLTDENLLDFWKFEFAKAGDYQKVKMISPITNKIGRFLFSPIAKRILEQGKSTINFESIMNDGKILLCNLSKGKLGEDNSEVFGIVLLTKLQLAALKRARVEYASRRDFYLYVDEFQNFATPAFAQILSEARKYRLNAILAHQTTSQLEDRSLVNVTLANTGSVICFRTANPDDETLILPQFRPYIEKGEIANLPSYRFYMKIGALNPEEPMSGMTVPVKIVENDSKVEKVINNSRMHYAKKYTVNKTPMKAVVKQTNINEAKKPENSIEALP